MSHGVRRTRQSPQDIEARRQKEASKIQEYLDLYNDVMSKKTAKEWSQEAFDLTTQLLRANPEIYTIWNYRRDILTNGVFTSKTPNEINHILASELQLTLSALRQHPKVYWIWNHRRWCLENTPNGPGTDESGEPGTPNDPLGWKRSNWAKELAVCEKMLDADARNFHAWSYRRYVVASSPDPRPLPSELAYSLKKIESNFSNFSAWHQRSKILPALWEGGERSEQEVKDQELELVKQAFYTDPNDQSAWLYHRWLIGPGSNASLLEQEIAVIQELLDIEPDSKWCIEAIVHYKRLLLRHKVQDADKLKSECAEGLRALARVDSQRRRRYEELGS
ncbi:Rab geranylgeranyltransferase [Tulasnella sp. 427]|nr:Rab geranylgeranyltransferase [Tulasnella sp. 427]